jgi:hypothetical protein
VNTGTAGTITEGRAIDSTDDGHLYVAGIQRDAVSGASKGFINTYDATGVAGVSMTFTGPMGEALEVNGIQVEDSGPANANVYVVGDMVDNTGAPNGKGFILEFDATTLAAVNAVTLTPPAGGKFKLNGIDLQEGSGGATAAVVVTGSRDDPANPPTQQLLAKYSPALVQTYAIAFNLSIDGVTPLGAPGNAIEVDSTGNIYVALQLQGVVCSAPCVGGNVPAYEKIDSANPPNLVWGVFFFNTTAGNLGSGTGIEIANDAAGDKLYVTGNLNDGTATDLLIARGPAATFPTSPLDYGFSYPPNPGGFITANGVENDVAGAAGHAFVVGTFNNPAVAAANFAHVTEFDATGMIVAASASVLGTASPTATTNTAGLAIEYNHQTQVVSTTGWTEAPDFNAMPSGTVPSNTFAGPRDGWVTSGTLAY